MCVCVCGVELGGIEMGKRDIYIYIYVCVCVCVCVCMYVLETLLNVDSDRLPLNYLELKRTANGNRKPNKPP